MCVSSLRGDDFYFANPRCRRPRSHPSRFEELCASEATYDAAMGGGMFVDDRDVFWTTAHSLLSVPRP